MSSEMWPAGVCIQRWRVRTNDKKLKENTSPPTNNEQQPTTEGQQ